MGHTSAARKPLAFTSSLRRPEGERAGRIMQVDGVLAGMVAIGVIGGLFRLLTGSPTLNTDGNQALYWGHQVITGHVPTYIVGTGISPHPLWIAYASLCALGGSQARNLMLVLPYAGIGALVWGGFQLGSALGSRWTGLITAALIVTSGPVLVYVGLNEIDVAFAAAVVWALVLEARSPRRGRAVLVMLAVAGLIRPEAWALSVVYLAYVVRDAPTGRARAAMVMLALAAPVIWCLIDFSITGDPLFSLNAAVAYATAYHIPHQGVGAVRETGYVFREILGIPVLLAGVVGALLVIRGRDRRALPVLACAVIGAVEFIATGVHGLAQSDRYALYAAVSVGALAAYGVTGVLTASSGRAWRRAGIVGAAVILAALVVSLPGRVSAMSTGSSQVSVSHTRFASLRALVGEPAVQTRLSACATVTAATPSMESPLIRIGNVRGNQLPPSGFSVPASGSLAFLTVVRSPATSGWFSSLEQTERRWMPPAGAGLRDAVDGYGLYTRGC